MEVFPKCFSGSDARKQPSTTIEQLCHRFSFPQLQKLTHNFHQSRLIERGDLGEVYRASITINGQPKEIAIKRARSNSPPEMALIENEILLLCQLHHPNLISLIGFCNDKKEMIVVYEYMPNGTLAHQLFSSDSLLWKKRLEISIGAARGLHYLHTGAKRTIVHRNFKLTKVVLDENWVPKITDLGLSFKGPKFSSKPKPIEVAVAGTVGYVAPEYLVQGILSDKSDVYSFGVVLVELVCGKSSSKLRVKMERDKNIDKDVDVGEGEGEGVHFFNIGKELKNFVERGNGERIIDPNLVGKIGAECWKLYIDIAERCLNRDDNERPAMGEVEVELERALELQEQAEANNELVDPTTTSNPQSQD